MGQGRKTKKDDERWRRRRHQLQRTRLEEEERDEDEQGEEEGGGTSSRRNNSGDMVDGARQRRDGTGQEKVRTGRNGTAPSASRQRERMETG